MDRVAGWCIINANECDFQRGISRPSIEAKWNVPLINDARYAAAGRRKRQWFRVAMLSFPVWSRGRIKRVSDRDSHVLRARARLFA